MPAPTSTLLGFARATLCVLCLLFSHPVDDVKSSAAFCYGNMIMGNLVRFLPKLLALIRGNPDRQYDMRIDRVIDVHWLCVCVVHHSLTSCLGWRDLPGRYLLLTSLKECISQHVTGAVAAALDTHLTEINSILFENAENKDEGVRAMVSECLGKLALVNPKLMLPRMAERLTGSAFTRGALTRSLNYCCL
jgi:cullin-associated NEDD8-dissociated protein 1